MQFDEYIRPVDLEEAWQLNQKRANRVLGGTMWMKMSPGRFRTAIDLCDLGLDKIEEMQDHYRIGCMASLHALERHEGLNRLTHGALREALEGIVGVQFRNCATLGGSLWRRAGFSDVLTIFMAMEAEAELYRAGQVSMEAFAAMKPDNDLLIYVHVPKKNFEIVYQSMRNTRTDFPVLTCAMTRQFDRFTAVIGARPMRAVKLTCPLDMEAEAFAAHVQQSLVYGSDMRASAEYRRHLAGVLIRRGFERLGGIKHED